MLQSNSSAQKVQIIDVRQVTERSRDKNQKLQGETLC